MCPQALQRRQYPAKYSVALACAFAFAFVLVVFAAFAFLAFAFALLVAFAFLASAFTQHREIHGYNITSGGIRLCSAIVEEHRPDLRVALQDVAVQVAVVLHLRWCQCK